jgi:hypothetical protein
MISQKALPGSVPSGKSARLTPPRPKIMSPASQRCGYPEAPSVQGLAAWRKVLGLYRKRSGAMSFEHGAKSERRSVFDTAT